MPPVKTEAEIQKLLQSDIKNLEWCRMNMMKMNISKIKIMLYRTVGRIEEFLANQPP